MGFALTLIYIVLTIVSPEQFGPTFGSYHPMVFLAGGTAVASAPSILGYARRRLPVQTVLLLAFLVAIALSQLANGWFGGVVQSWQAILPSAAVFLFVVINVNTVRRLKIIILVTVGTCLGLVVETLCGYYDGFRGDFFVLLQNGELYRLRAAGFLHDPNDFAQLLLIALSLIILGWNQGRAIANWLIVVIPAASLFWAIYLTHSRGALIGLAVLALVTAQKKIGKTTSVLLAGLLIFGMMALDFTGGRGISATEGADRLEASATGLELFKSAPLFGIGFGRFTDFNDITAHNSFVLCLAELGLVGSTLWVALFVTTLMDLSRSITIQEELLPNETGSVGELQLEQQSKPLRCELPLNPPTLCMSEGEVPWKFARDPLGADRSLLVNEGERDRRATLLGWAPDLSGPYPRVVTDSDGETKVATDGEYVALKPFAVVMRLALISFLTTSCFLSRSYVTTMYLTLGLATATLALERPTFELGNGRRWVVFTLGAEALAIIFMYCIVRLRH